MVDVGTGPPLVLVPGIQGRWEWMSPTVRALAARFRVLCASLPGEPGPESAAWPAADFDAHVGLQIELLDRARVERAVVVGVSFGGLVAGRLAAAHPRRVSALVLASTPGPHWAPDVRARRYAQAPWLMFPAFVARTPWRLGPEIAAACDTTAGRLGFVAAQLGRVLRCPARPGRMGGRLRLMVEARDHAWWQRVEAPTLVLTGERALDRVVPVDGTIEYARVIPGARAATLPRTGHLGSVTRPDAFAELVWEFYNESRVPSL